MIPKVAGKGRSFKGAGAYYLHDKKASTRERVAFTLTLNLATDDPDKAIGWMAHTAMRQAEIKKAAGGVAKGRKLRDPVYAYSLSWAPDEKPTPEQMIAAARDTLKRLGLEQHEALLVAHNDEPHPHIHVIVNRVNPETGIAAPLSNDHLILSEWALAYEKEHGKIRCEQRQENSERRKRQFVKDRASRDKGEFHRWRRERARAAYEQRMGEKAALGKVHKDEREALKAERNHLIREARDTLKEQYRPQWADLFRRQRIEQRNLNEMEKSNFGRLRYWLKNRHFDRFGGPSEDRQAMLSRAFQIVADRDPLQAILKRRQEAERKALTTRIEDHTRQSLKDIYRASDRILAEIRQRQATEKEALRDKQLKQRRDEERRKTLGGDRTAFDFEKAVQPPAARNRLTELFNKSVEGAGGKEPARETFNEAAKPGLDPPAAEAQPPSPASPEAARTEEEKPEKKRFSAFRDRRDDKEEQQDRDRGRERRLKPPGDKSSD